MPVPEGDARVAPMRVLIVEDTEERQAVLTALYRAHAWVLVHTGQRAITLVHAFCFDIISLDYHLRGELNGGDVARAIAQSRNSDARVIIHSMNRRGAEEVARLLPAAIRFPVSRMIRSNGAFKALRANIDAFGAAYEWR